MDEYKSFHNWKFKISLLFCNHSTPIVRIGSTTLYLSRKRQRQLMRYSWMTTLPSLLFLVAMTRIVRSMDFGFDSFLFDFLISLVAYLAVFYLLGFLVTRMLINNDYVDELLEESKTLQKKNENGENPWQ